MAFPCQHPHKSLVCTHSATYSWTAQHIAAMIFSGTQYLTSNLTANNWRKRRHRTLSKLGPSGPNMQTAQNLSKGSQKDARRGGGDGKVRKFLIHCWLFSKDVPSSRRRGELVGYKWSRRLLFQNSPLPPYNAMSLLGGNIKRRLYMGTLRIVHGNINWGSNL